MKAPYSVISKIFGTNRVIMYDATHRRKEHKQLGGPYPRGRRRGQVLQRVVHVPCLESSERAQMPEAEEECEKGAEHCAEG